MPGQVDTPFPYAGRDLAAIELALSPERFQSYLHRSGGDKLKAVYLYERNTYLSEALYGVIQALEITLRNSIHRVFSTAYTPEWYDKINVFEAPLDTMLRDAQVRTAARGSSVTAGRIVAELNLGFWTALTAAKYEKTLWVPHLHEVFSRALKKTKNGNSQISLVKIDRAEIHSHLDEIRFLRNRIAHHEPILRFDLSKRYADVLAMIFWLCPTTSKWVRSTNCFHTRLNRALPNPPTAVQNLGK
jgi:abortive infection bacteriophage resistance protein